MKSKDRKLRVKESKFLKNLAMGMTYADAYEAAGYKTKTRESSAACGFKLLKRLHEAMSDREMLDAMVPTSRVIQVTNEIMETSADDNRLRAASLIGKWKQMETPEGGPAQGATIIIVRQLPDSDITAMDVTPGNQVAIQPPKRISITD